MKTKSFWIPSVVFAAGLALAMRGESTPKAIGYFLVAETALFALAFLLATLLGGPDRVLALGVALAVVLSICSAVFLGEDCDEGSFELVPCWSSFDAFWIGLLASLFFYPGWALGAIAGARTSMGRRRSW
jgi:hypothetical protein